MENTVRTIVLLLFPWLMFLGPAGQALTAAQAPETDLPILGLAGVTVRASDLEKARGYYKGVLGFPEAFDIKDSSGKVLSAYFKVNDDQYIEVVPNLNPGELHRIGRVMI